MLFVDSHITMVVGARPRRPSLHRYVMAFVDFLEHERQHQRILVSWYAYSHDVCHACELSVCDGINDCLQKHSPKHTISNKNGKILCHTSVIT